MRCTLRPSDCYAHLVRLLFLIALSLALTVGCRTAVPVTPVKATFHEVDAFTGSSLGEDARIYAARLEGIGEVYATIQTFGPGVELIVRSHPRQDAPVVAYLDYEFSADGGWEIAFKANEPGLREEITRVNHEDYGLVVASIRGGWAKAVYGYDLTGEVRFGWVHLVPGSIVFVSYDDLLAQHLAYFEDPGRVELFDKPNGRRVEFPLTSRVDANMSYSLSVLAIERDWIQVALEVPSTEPCGGDPEAKVERSTYAWVRRYDSKGRYQIGYSAGGC